MSGEVVVSVWAGVSVTQRSHTQLSCDTLAEVVQLRLRRARSFGPPFSCGQSLQRQAVLPLRPGDEELQLSQRLRIVQQ